MKKLFVSILALAAFAACQSDFNNDVNLGAPQGGSVVSQGEHTIYAEVGIGEETKATYGDDLSALWEENDQIALLQEHADYNKTFGTVNKLNIKEGWGTSYASFNGDILVDATDPRVYHIAYPADAVSFSTASELNLVGSITYENNSAIAGYKLKAHGTYEYVYNSTLNITVPTTQNGKWEPYMYVSTEAVASNAIGARELTTLTGAIAIRAFEADGVTPKQLKQITITSSDAAIAGTFSGTSTSVGSLGEVVGDETAWHTAFEESSAKSKALASLESKVQGMEPTSTTVTKKLSLAFNGTDTDKSIVATDLTSIAADANGYYTYYINVAPATLAAGTLTIVAVAADGSNLVRVIDNTDVVIAASHRAGFNLKWESATLKCDAIDSWYDDWNKGSQFQLAGNTLYVDNIIVDGNIVPENVKVIGIKINDVLHEETAKSGVKELSPIVLSGMTSGVYKVQPVAQVELNGELVWLEGGAVTKTITAIPTVIDYSVITSYSNNGKVAKDNKINGNILKVKANLSDSYAAGLAGNKYLIYNGGSKIGEQTLNQEWNNTVAWGAYDCCVKVQLPNGYVVESQHYTTHVTGIPYSIDLRGVTNPTNWSASNTDKNVFLCMKEGKNAYVVSMPFGVPENCNVTVTIPMYAYGGSINGKYNPYVYASATSSTSGIASGASTQLSGSNKLPESGASYTNWTPTVTLSNGAPRVSIYSTGSGSNWSVGGGSMGVIMKSITVQYQL
ncbi:MAG: hypothetical protein IKB90_03590 [Alistipes sp.]|nr:hypothetical protein [Alistipes sp.]